MVAQLYFAPGSSGAACYIAAHKAGILGSKIAPNITNVRSKAICTGPNKGRSLFEINPKGTVPTIVLDDAVVLTEGSACLQWIADQNPDAALAPPYGTLGRYQLQEKLNWLASELHAVIGPLFNFNGKLTNELRDAGLDKLQIKLKLLSDVGLAGGRTFLVGDEFGFTVADAYCYVVLSWLKHLNVALCPHLQAYFDRIADLSFVQEAEAKIAEMSAAA